MLGFLGRALSGMVLTKDARKAVHEARGRAAAQSASKGKAGSVAALQAQGKEFVTPERAELLQSALKVRSAKQKILADLSDEQRARLVGVAMKRLLNEGKD